MSWLSWIYSFALLLMSLFGANMLVLIVLGVRAWQRERRATAASRLAEPAPGAWPRALVQLPLYNERTVAERLIDTVTRLDYPVGRLAIQVLDDTTGRHRRPGAGARGLPPGAWRGHQPAPPHQPQRL
jgi:cellulose synthase/poly-beta-1,6-N-acetylglucosamine synthase-like glycosyltransferase